MTESEYSATSHRDPSCQWDATTLEWHRGFTVIELLVVLAVIAVLCTLVLPAVQQARESARRVQCTNNLHQIGVALQSYYASVNCYPSGWIIKTPVGTDSRNGWGWLAMVLPQFDERPLFNSINFCEQVGHRCNVTARLSTIESLMCPSDNVPPRIPFFRYSALNESEEGATKNGSTVRHEAGSVMFEVAGASYAGVFGCEDPPGDPADASGDGSFFANSRVRSGDIFDGLSYTLVVGERSVRRLATTWTGMHHDEEERFERVVGFTDHCPNDPAADEAEFSSRHHGGVHFLLGDGSVRFVSDHIDRSLYRALGTRAGHESIPCPSF
jgi:prepilin-type N-terminal cleavage/methylation domain-containing protein